jgi:hypothetical protein
LPEPAPDPATRLLFFVRTALRTRDAHLTDGVTGGAPAAANTSTAAYYGWGASAGGGLEAYGTWVGCVAETGEGRRVYLYPERALGVVPQMAGLLGVSFPWTRTQLDAALRHSGLITTAGQRCTRLRRLPGNDLTGQASHQQVWDLPAGEVLGDLPGEDGALDAAKGGVAHAVTRRLRGSQRSQATFFPACASRSLSGLRMTTRMLRTSWAPPGR